MKELLVALNYTTINCRQQQQQQHQRSKENKKLFHQQHHQGKRVEAGGFGGCHGLGLTWTWPSSGRAWIVRKIKHCRLVAGEIGFFVLRQMQSVVYGCFLPPLGAFLLMTTTICLPAGQPLKKLRGYLLKLFFTIAFNY